VQVDESDEHFTGSGWIVVIGSKNIIVHCRNLQIQFHVNSKKSRTLEIRRNLYFCIMSRPLTISLICFSFQSRRNISGYPKITWTNWNIFNLFIYLILNLTWGTEGGDYEMAVLCFVAQCIMVRVYQGLRGLYCLHPQGDAWRLCSHCCLLVAIKAAKFSFFSVSNPRCISPPAFYYTTPPSWTGSLSLTSPCPSHGSAELCFHELLSCVSTSFPDRLHSSSWWWRKYRLLKHW
jgi:hypothetical protein